MDENAAQGGAPCPSESSCHALSTRAAYAPQDMVAQAVGSRERFSVEQLVCHGASRYMQQVGSRFGPTTVNSMSGPHPDPLSVDGDLPVSASGYGCRAARF